MKNNKNLVISLVIGVIALVVLIFGATYAYFAVIGANNTYNTSITANVAPGGGSFDATTADFNFDVSLENMSVSEGVSIAGISDTGYIVVNATSPVGSIMTCTYDLDFEWTSDDQYISYSDLETMTAIEEDGDPFEIYNHDWYIYDHSLPEFWLRVFGDPGDDGYNNFAQVYNLTILSEIEHIVEGATIKSYNGQTNSKKWNIFSGINNLPVNQNSLAGKDYSYNLSITNVECELETIDMDDYYEEPHIGDLYEVGGEQFYYLSSYSDYSENEDGDEVETVKYVLMGVNPLYVNLGDNVVMQANESHPATKVAISNSNSCDIFNGYENMSYDDDNFMVDWNLGENTLTNILDIYGEYIGAKAYLLDEESMDFDYSNGIIPQDGWGNYGRCSEEVRALGSYYDLIANFDSYDDNLRKYGNVTDSHYIYPIIEILSEDLN